MAGARLRGRCRESKQRKIKIRYIPKNQWDRSKDSSMSAAEVKKSRANATEKGVFPFANSVDFPNNNEIKQEVRFIRRGEIQRCRKTYTISRSCWCYRQGTP
mmetsp:Transcript_13693/g.22660  ORF Transcript_13693/g.22660 Transcript_13693/m.22660 type:complete len:102 (-) Transcript_13693:341-646(-)